MGFTTPQAAHALRRSNGVVATAVEWLIAHPLEHPTDDADMLEEQNDNENDEDELDEKNTAGGVPATAVIDPVRFIQCTIIAGTYRMMRMVARMRCVRMNAAGVGVGCHGINWRSTQRHSIQHSRRGRTHALRIVSFSFSTFNLGRACRAGKGTRGGAQASRGATDETSD